MKNPLPKNISDPYVPYAYPQKNKLKFEQPCRWPDMTFLDVLLNRRSSNSSFKRLSLAELARILFLSTRIHEIQTDDSGFIISKRTTPSGGARHPVDLLVSMINDQWRRELFYYNPIDHTLAELQITPSRLRAFHSEISENMAITDACVVWFSIQHSKTSSKYHNPESLYWRDAGALLYCIQLIVTYLGYQSRPIGTLASESFYKLFDSVELISGGGVMIGK